MTLDAIELAGLALDAIDVAREDASRKAGAR